MMTRTALCPNQNHRRSDAKVRCCPNCGEIVNKEIMIKQCSNENHAKERKNMSKFCVHCGQQIVP